MVTSLFNSSFSGKLGEVWKYFRIRIRQSTRSIFIFLFDERLERLPFFLGQRTIYLQSHSVNWYYFYSKTLQKRQKFYYFNFIDWSNYIFSNCKLVGMEGRSLLGEPKPDACCTNFSYFLGSVFLGKDRSKVRIFCYFVGIHINTTSWN